MIQAVANLLTGSPPVAAPANLEKFECAANVTAGQVVKLNVNGTVQKAVHTDDFADAFGIALEDGLSATDDKIRVQYIVPGVVLMGSHATAQTIGTEVGLHEDADRFDVSNDGAIVIKYKADYGGVDHMLWVVPTEGHLFQKGSA